MGLFGEVGKWTLYIYFGKMDLAFSGFIHPLFPHTHTHPLFLPETHGRRKKYIKMRRNLLCRISCRLCCHVALAHEHPARTRISGVRSKRAEVGYGRPHRETSGNLGRREKKRVGKVTAPVRGAGVRVEREMVFVCCLVCLARVV